jgi:hypothetical protein
MTPWFRVPALEGSLVVLVARCHGTVGPAHEAHDGPLADA